MKTFTSLVITLSLLLTINSVSADKSTEIYKWVDKDGYVHYAQRPGDDNAKKMHLGSQRFKATNTDQELAEQKAKEREETCQSSKATLAKYEKAPFLYRYDEKKQQKIRLSKAESEEAMQQARKDVNYWCNDNNSAEEITQNTND